MSQYIKTDKPQIENFKEQDVNMQIFMNMCFVVAVAAAAAPSSASPHSCASVVVSGWLLGFFVLNFCLTELR